MKVALMCDSMSAYAGAERVIEQLLNLFPDADVYALLDLVPQSQRGFLQGKSVQTSWLQRLPGVSSYYQRLLPLYGIAIEQIDLTPYDLVISSHHSVAHGVITRPHQRHISYVHSPMRYAWDLQHQYLAQAGLDRGPLSWLARRYLHSARLWDYAAAQRPDTIVANSHFIKNRIRKCYRRHAPVVYPPVDIRRLSGLPGTTGGDYLSVSRLVPYKRLDILVEAFAMMPNRRLKIIGSGSEWGKLTRNAPANVSFLGWQPNDRIEAEMAGASAFLFAGIEDFGITLVEAQAAGTPVIAYADGGALESVRDLSRPRPTGVLFKEQTPRALVDAIDRFENNRPAFIRANCRENVERFSQDVFRGAMQKLVAEVMNGDEAFVAERAA